MYLINKYRMTSVRIPLNIKCIWQHPLTSAAYAALPRRFQIENESRNTFEFPLD